MGSPLQSLLKHIVSLKLSKIIVKMGNLWFTFLLLLLCTVTLSSAAVGPIDLCGLIGCCGTGMHTPAADGTYTGVDNHLYTIYDPRADGEETWDNWNLICRTSVEGGRTGKVVVLESRAELDCLIEYMNNEFDDPIAPRKYTLGPKGQTTQNVGIFKWQGVDASINFDAATNWKTGSPTGGPCPYMEIGQTSAVNGLWWALVGSGDCNKAQMLGICEFE